MCNRRREGVQQGRQAGAQARAYLGPPSCDSVGQASRLATLEYA
jgi:hypothetical protein